LKTRIRRLWSILSPCDLRVLLGSWRSQLRCWGITAALWTLSKSCFTGHCCCSSKHCCCYSPWSVFQWTV